ncbi:putative aminopeptidase [Calothrix sp. NIES-4071]|nr:putative aminopeptidase [Calothrix sp. NIES-4071]BAZ55392.1 putative aminopeptidase [Calothrix sp. NIES-4105]
MSVKPQTKSWLKVVLTTTLLLTPIACAVQNITTAQQPTVKQKTQNQTYSQVYTDVQNLVNMGPRVAGTPINEKASAYIEQQYRKAGYRTRIQTFTYSKFRDAGSSLTVDGTTIKANALFGSAPGKLSARLVAVPNKARAEDFAKVNVKGAIAIVKRGEIRFTQKVDNAVNAGAVGVVIVNNKSGNLAGGTLTQKSKIPVLGISGDDGDKLYARSLTTPLTINFNANGQNVDVTGRNVIAFQEGVTQPKVILGGHFDSVELAPGANDNASGTAVVLDIARKVSNTPLARQAWFIAFDGEEDGLHGSRAFVDAATPQFLSELKGMMNFDMVGVNDKLLIGGSSELTKIAQVVQPKAQLFGASYANGASDHAPFAARGVPILFFYRGMEPNYHSRNDKTVDPKLLDETTQAGLDIFKRLVTN